MRLLPVGAQLGGSNPHVAAHVLAVPGCKRIKEAQSHTTAYQPLRDGHRGLGLEHEADNPQRNSKDALSPGALSL
jgi:hypothetical protein